MIPVHNPLRSNGKPTRCIVPNHLPNKNATSKIHGENPNKATEIIFAHIGGPKTCHEAGKLHGEPHGRIPVHGLDGKTKIDANGVFTTSLKHDRHSGNVNLLYYSGRSNLSNHKNPLPHPSTDGKTGGMATLHMEVRPDVHGSLERSGKVCDVGAIHSLKLLAGG